MSGVLESGLNQRLRQFPQLSGRRLATLGAPQMAVSPVNLYLSTTPFNVDTYASQFPVSPGTYNVFFVPSIFEPNPLLQRYGQVDAIPGQRAFIALIGTSNTVAHELGHLLGNQHTSLTYTDPNTAQQVSNIYRLMYPRHTGRGATIVPSEGATANP